MSFASKAEIFCLMSFSESKGFNHLPRNLKCLVLNGSFSVGLTMNLIGRPSITSRGSNGEYTVSAIGVYFSFLIFFSNIFTPRAMHLLGFAFIVWVHLSHVFVESTDNCISCVLRVISVRSSAYALMNVETVGVDLNV